MFYLSTPVLCNSKPSKIVANEQMLLLQLLANRSVLDISRERMPSPIKIRQTSEGSDQRAYEVKKRRHDEKIGKILFSIWCFRFGRGIGFQLDFCLQAQSRIDTGARNTPVSIFGGL